MIQLPPGVEVSVPSASAIPAERFIGGPPIAPTTPIPAPVIDEPTLPSPEMIDDVTTVAPPRRSRAKWRLVLPNGDEHVVDGPTVVGRAPSAKAAGGEAEVLAVDDPDGLISKSHAVFEVDGGQLWVRDLKSTNGVVIVGVDESEREVPSGGSAELVDGDEVELGSYAIRIQRGAR
jgi:hypothetical protein